MPGLSAAEHASLTKRQAAKLEKASAGVEAAAADVEESKTHIAAAKSALEKLNASLANAKDKLRQKTVDRNDLVEQLRGELGSKRKPAKLTGGS